MCVSVCVFFVPFLKNIDHIIWSEIGGSGGGVLCGGGGGGNAGLITCLETARGTAKQLKCRS